MTVCHMPRILFLEPFTECAHSVRIRTDTTLDQDCVLKATVQVCTACMVVSLLTTCMSFNTPPLAQIAPFDAKFASQTRKYHSTKKLRKHVCHFKAFKLQRVQAITMALVQAQHGPEKASALSLSSSRVIGLIKVVRQASKATSQSSRNFALRVALALLLLCSLLS